MKRTILFFVCLMGMTFSFAQSRLQDVVYLKNGSVIRGEIIEMVSGETVKIQTIDGSVFIHDLADVERFIKEQSKGISIFKKKSPWLSGGLSCFIPGLGQFYNGENRKGWIDLGISAAGWGAAIAGVHLDLSYLPEDFTRVEDGFYSPERDMYVTGVEFCHHSEFLRITGYALFAAGIITVYTNAIHSIIDAAKSSNRINSANGYVMYQLNDHCAFGMQPSLAYERPQYLQGSKPELSAGMKFKLTF